MTDKFQELYKIDVSDKTEKKGNLTYLSWTWAWAEFKKVYPDANYQVKTFDGVPYVHDSDTGYMVFTSVTAGGMTYDMWLPVMDARNKALKQADMFDINKAIMRCLTKNLAMFGLGLYIYAGEDLPEGAEEVPERPKKTQQSANMAAQKPAPKYKPITEKELTEVYGVKDPKATIAGLEKQMGLPFAEWGEDGTIAARSWLDSRKKKREQAEEVEPPFPMTDDEAEE